jgi:glyoxylase-like metal-dependent hydrolase (beta-lactamase superfamily II)
MKIKKHIVSPLQTNCFVVWDEDSGLAMVIDPGGSAKKVSGTLKEKGLTLEAIVHTHSHWDHTAGSDALQRITGAPIFRHHQDMKSGFLHRPRKADEVKVHDLVDNQVLKIGGLTFTVLHTPGHSRGGICLYGGNSNEEAGPDKVLFSGDLLFEGSVGRTDLRGGDLRTLLKSLVQRLSFIPDNTIVYTGHGPATVLGHERKNNPYFKLALQRGLGDKSEDG